MKIKTRVILKAVERKMTGVSKRAIAKKKATKKAKTTARVPRRFDFTADR